LWPDCIPIKESHMRNILAAVALLGVSAFATAAQAAPHCDLRANLLQQAGEMFREAPTAAGVMHDGRLFEVWATESGSTWTAIVTQVDEQGRKISCVMTAGDDWQDVEAAAADPGA
jgi:hypothetical protein